MTSAPGWNSYTTVDQDKVIDSLANLGVDLEPILTRIATRAFEEGHEQGVKDTEERNEE